MIIKKITSFALGMSLFGFCGLACASDAYIPDPSYIHHIPVLDTTTMPYSFDMVSEPDILPIIPEKEIQKTQVVVADKLLTEYKLLSDILFAFDKHTLNPKSQVFLDDVVKNVFQIYKQVDSIVVVGHTDRLGSNAYNYNLGMKRAQTVKDYLALKGLPLDLISATSAGETMPVTDGCPNVKNRASLKQCLQPDRRVEIKVEGMGEPDVFPDTDAPNDDPKPAQAPNNPFNAQPMPAPVNSNTVPFVIN